MYTKCPQCEKQRTIKAEELRFSRGMISCEECASLFNAFELLQAGTVDAFADTTEISDSPAKDDAIPNSSELLHAVSNKDDLSEASDVLPTSFNEGFIPDASNLLLTDAGEDLEHDVQNTQDSISEKKEQKEENTAVPSPDEETEDEDFFLFEKAPQKRKPIWTWAFSGCLILLAFQVYFFEGYSLTQNSKVRPWLEKICKPLKCQLPAYQNSEEFSILHGSFEPATNKKYYIFKAVFVNQSDFKQNHPSIKLSLQDFRGQTTAERVFHPQDYLKNGEIQIEPEQSAEITLNIVAPSKKMGGYSFELI